MIHRYDYGTPINTGAVILDIKAEQGDPTCFAVTKKDGAIVFSCDLAAEDMIFGLGEMVRGINKRGHIYRSWNSDEPHHHEEKRSLYASHNLLLFSGADKCFGAYFDDPGEIIFDLGYTHMTKAEITCTHGDVALYIIEGSSMVDICREFRTLVGRSYVPPRWALGYIQSRWGYSSEAELREVAQNHRSRHIPLESLSMDIDYMDNFKDFTWDSATFPNLKQFSEDLKKDHLHLIPIIDAGVKEQEGYDVYDEGMKKGYFVKKADGSTFIGAVWPGRSVFPDFLQEDVRDWFGEKYHRLMASGVEGFWNDMNEPALFYSEESLAEAFAYADTMRGKNLDIHNAFSLQTAFDRMANNPDDYRRFYHTLNGKSYRHDRVHNLFGMYMTEAAARGLRSFDPEKRFLLFSRSSFMGAHRFAGIWQGDNCSYWSHILLNLKMMPSLNMCGFIYTGADIGGFGENTTADLLERWLQLGVFTPLMRNHSAMGTREQEIYRFDEWEMMRDTVGVRYALLPYLYSEMMKAILTDGMMFRPLAFDYPGDMTAARTEDQVMLGECCMLAPVYEQNATGRHVYLPEDMLLVRFRSAEDYDCVAVPAGHCYVNLQLNEFPLFIRKNCLIPLAKAAEYSEAVDDSNLTLLGWLEDDVDAFCTLYRDDGYTTAPTLEENITPIIAEVYDGKVHVSGEGLTLNTDKLVITK